MAKITNKPMRVFINGERIEAELVSNGLGEHGLIIDGEDLTGFVNAVDLRDRDDCIAVVHLYVQDDEIEPLKEVLRKYTLVPKDEQPV